ncbi:hypothetical protein FOA52_010262 [Chlamydomonas sp. UWO 241]|nr:hypothetical protein FOA52_010262 [Chlamydomonas sp. UWO 241]
MFGGLFGGGGDGKDGEVQPQGQGDKGASSTRGFDLWGVANAVSASVRARADEIAQSVATTDWGSELSSFRQAAAAEVNTAREAVEQLEHLPKKAAAVTARLPTMQRRSSAGGAGPLLDASLDAVGETLSQFSSTLLQGTREFVHQVRDGLGDDLSAGGAAAPQGGSGGRGGRSAATTPPLPQTAHGTGAAQALKYSRMESEVAAMQRDSVTFLGEPDAADDFDAWRATFSLLRLRTEADQLLSSSAFVSELHARVVPAVVSDDLFWARYFYRLSKLQQKEEQRSTLAQRVQTISAQEEEELGWDDLDPDVDEEGHGGAGDAAGGGDASLPAPAPAPSEGEVPEEEAATEAQPQEAQLQQAAQARHTEEEAACSPSPEPAPEPDAPATASQEAQLELAEEGQEPGRLKEEQEQQEGLEAEADVRRAAEQQPAPTHTVKADDAAAAAVGCSAAAPEPVAGAGELGSDSSDGRADWSVVGDGGDGDGGSGDSGGGRRRSSSVAVEEEASAAASGPASAATPEDVLDDRAAKPGDKGIPSKPVAAAGQAEEEDDDWGNWD